MSLTGPRILKSDSNIRNVIPPDERLTLHVAIILRFLAYGESEQSLTFLFRVWRSTISGIIRETCDAI